MNFNFIARFYAFGIWLFFGKRFYQSQADYINNFKEKNFLVVGSGDGRLLKLLNRKGKKVLAIDQSKSMVLLAKKHLKEDIENLQIKQLDFFQIDIHEKFDCIFFPFFLDNFSDQNILKAFKKAEEKLNRAGKILVVDFNPKNNDLNFKVKLKILYWFFYSMVKIQRKQLPSWERLIDISNLELVGQDAIFKNQILCFTLKAKHP